ncbi:MAG: LLM class flavin-dependent oxidoreductase, partial [Acidimicrobiia bacterium]
MRIGLINELHGRPDGDTAAPSWASVRERALVAEQIGFDMFVYEDVLLYRGEDTTDGVWESMAISAALAEATTSIRFGQSVINSPYRSPAMTASIAETINEISGGRYVLGIGAGNTADSDYVGFGFPTDHRYSRFAEAIEIIHTLSRTGTATFSGRFYEVDDAELVLRGTDSDGPFINIAAGGPKMMRLVAEYADAWNWWGYDMTIDQLAEHLQPKLDMLAAACVEIGRDPDTIVKTVDLYSITPPGFEPPEGRKNTVFASTDDVVAYLLGMRELGIGEVRIDLTDS